MTARILYTCPTCKQSYATRQEAEACRDRVEYDPWQIGDFATPPLRKAPTPTSPTITGITVRTLSARAT